MHNNTDRTGTNGTLLAVRTPPDITSTRVHLQWHWQPPNPRTKARPRTSDGGSDSIPRRLSVLCGWGCLATVAAVVRALDWHVCILGVDLRQRRLAQLLETDQGRSAGAHAAPGPQRCRRGRGIRGRTSFCALRCWRSSRCPAFCARLSPRRASRCWFVCGGV